MLRLTTYEVSGVVHICTVPLTRLRAKKVFFRTVLGNRFLAGEQSGILSKYLQLHIPTALNNKKCGLLVRNYHFYHQDSLFLRGN